MKGSIVDGFEVCGEADAGEARDAVVVWRAGLISDDGDIFSAVGVGDVEEAGGCGVDGVELVAVGGGMVDKGHLIERNTLRGGGACDEQGGDGA